MRDKSGSYRRPGITTTISSRAVRAHAARFRAERDTQPRRVDATVTLDSMALRVRAAAVLLLFFVGWGVLLFRAGWLAIGPDARLSERLAGQHERVVQVAPQRGSILDRMGRVLAVGVEMESVFADPTMVEDPAATADLLAPILGKDAAGLREKLSRTGTRFVWLARQVPDDVAVAVREIDVPGVRITAEAHRDYPSGSLASQALGFVGGDGQGLEGLEARFDSDLMGDVVEYRVLRDGRRRAVNYDGVLSRRSTEGHTLVLTLDHSIQHRAEMALAAAIERHQAAGGWLVVMDPRDGSLLAIASAPTFDPNDVKGVDPRLFRSKAVAEVYEPGSVMKSFVLAEVLERGLAKPTDIVYCERGAYRIGRRTVHDTHSYGDLTVDQVLQLSSNIGAAKLGERLGPAGLESALRRFGFGARTGIELREDTGLLYPSSKWSRIGFATHCFGQGMAITGIQLASAFAALVNGGEAVQPHLVAEIRDVDGAIVRRWRRGAEPRRVISEETSREVRRILGLVVLPEGTAPRAAMKEYTSGGKTGTAQKVKDGRYAKGAYVASFVGFAPLDDPRVVVLVALDEPHKGHFGGTTAAPVFREVTTHALRELGVRPDIVLPTLLDRARQAPASVLAAADEGAPESEPAEIVREAAPADLPLPVLAGPGPWEMPDLAGRSLRDVVALIGPLGVGLDLDGSGLVASQEPAPGEMLEPTGRVALLLGLPDRPAGALR